MLEQLRKALLDGTFQEGHTSEVAQRYGVTTQTALRALQTLKKEGLVTCMDPGYQGQGHSRRGASPTHYFWAEKWD